MNRQGTTTIKLPGPIGTESDIAIFYSKGVKQFRLNSFKIKQEDQDSGWLKLSDPESGLNSLLPLGKCSFVIERDNAENITLEEAAFTDYDRMSKKLFFQTTAKPLEPLVPQHALPISLIGVCKQVNAELMVYLKTHPEELHRLQPRRFEELIAEILASHGWEVQLTSPSKDGGYDIFGISKADPSGLRSSWIIECKKYRADRKIGVDIIRSLYGATMKLHGVNALLATTSSFTKGARDFKASMYNFELRDYNDIVDWLNTYKPSSGGIYLKENHPAPPGNG